MSMAELCTIDVQPKKDSINIFVHNPKAYLTGAAYVAFNQFSYFNLDHRGLHKESSVTEGFNCSKITRSSITFHFIPDY